MSFQIYLLTHKKVFSFLFLGGTPEDTQGLLLVVLGGPCDMQGTEPSSAAVLLCLLSYLSVLEKGFLQLYVFNLSNTLNLRIICFPLISVNNPSKSPFFLVSKWGKIITVLHLKRKVMIKQDKKLVLLCFFSVFPLNMSCS